MTTWDQISPYALRSDCGRYTVGKVIHNGKIYYEAWFAKEVLGFGLSSAAQAKRIVEDHEIAHRTKPEGHKSGDQAEPAITQRGTP